MTTSLFTRRWIAAAALVCAVGVAQPVYAQNGVLRGKVVNADGRAMDRVEIALDLVGGAAPRQVKTITDKNGEWIRTGLPGGSTWSVTARLGKLSAKIAEAKVEAGQTIAVANMVITEGGAEKPASAVPNPTNLSGEEAKKRNERAAKLNELLKEANAAIESKNYDEALAKLDILAKEVETCAACHARMGDIYVQKNDLAAAEQAYLRAIELDPKEGSTYSALANVYNAQRKFDEAQKMSAKANELLGAAGGGGSATTIYNQGIILWNAGKAAEARDAFAQVIKLDPKLADAYFRLGLAIYSLTAGTPAQAEARAPLQEYLKLAPTGEHATTAKEILAAIK